MLDEAEPNHNIETEGHLFEIDLVDLAMTVLACFNGTTGGSNRTNLHRSV